MSVKRAAVIPLLGALIFSSPITLAADFETHPPTDAISGSTAYTLTAGEFQIGTLDFFFTIPSFSNPFNPSQLRWIWLEYGLTDRLHVGTTVAENVLEGPNFWSVFTAIRSPTLAIAVPFGADIDVAPFGVGADSGMLISLSATSALDVHSGLRFSVPSGGGFQITHIYSALDLGVAPNARAMAELDYFPQNTGSFGRQFAFNVGALTRIGFLNVEVSTRFLQRLFEPENFGFDLDIELHFRF